VKKEINVNISIVLIYVKIKYRNLLDVHKIRIGKILFAHMYIMHHNISQLKRFIIYKNNNK